MADDEPEYVYRITYSDGRPIRTGGYRGRQHVYHKRHVAQGVVTSWNNDTHDLSTYKVQRAKVEWEDFE
jgi:hypothetical protein